MSQPPTPPPPPPPSQPEPSGSSGGAVQVRCAGCASILKVGSGVVEFVCPSCKLPQMLPPQLLTSPPNGNGTQQKTAAATGTGTSTTGSGGVPTRGIDPTKIQLPCANCKALLNVPHGLTRFACPQCHVNLAVDFTKVKQFAPPPLPLPLPLPPVPPPEEVNEVLCCPVFFYASRMDLC